MVNLVAQNLPVDSKRSQSESGHKVGSWATLTSPQLENAGATLNFRVSLVFILHLESRFLSSQVSDRSFFLGMAKRSQPSGLRTSAHKYLAVTAGAGLDVRNEIIQLLKPPFIQRQ